jgi:hypothetical protein
VKGYDHSPLEEDRVAEFESKLRDIHQRTTSEYEKLVNSGTAKTESLSKNIMDLTSQQTQYKIERDNARQNIVCFSLPCRHRMCSPPSAYSVALDKNAEQDLS